MKNTNLFLSILIAGTVFFSSSAAAISIFTNPARPASSLVKYPTPKRAAPSQQACSTQLVEVPCSSPAEGSEPALCEVPKTVCEDI